MTASETRMLRLRPGGPSQYSISELPAKLEGTDNFYMKAYEGYLKVMPDNNSRKTIFHIMS